jgi:phosphoribosyl 1,2-cyclic phosphate phosphodiesterase
VKEEMRITMLGCGTSAGVPTIGCKCEVCTSEDPKNKRSRSSILISYGGNNVLVDTAPELRLQCLANDVDRVNAVLFTHSHADHINGIDELRIFNWLLQDVIHCYGDAKTVKHLQNIFKYIFSDERTPSYVPQLQLHVVDGEFELLGARVLPMRLMHGPSPVLGFRIGDFAYMTDCNHVPPESMKLLKGLKLLILGALRYEPHPTHFSLQEGIDLARKVKAERVIFTHLNHNLDYSSANEQLPEGMALGYDGLVLHV